MEKKKIWELQHTTICKVVGMAFDHADLKKIFRQFQLRVQDTHTDEEFVMHSAVVRMCEQENKVSRYVHKMVENRFSAYEKRLASKEMEDISRSVLNSGNDFGVPLWAIIWYLATRQASNGENIQTAVFGFIHMLEHRLVSDFWTNTGADYEKQLREHRIELAGLRKEIIRLQSANRDLEKQNRIAANKNVQPCMCSNRASSHCVSGTSWNDNNHPMKIQSLKCLLEEEREKNSRINEELDRAKRQIEALTLELTSCEQSDCILNASTENGECACPLRQWLEGKRIAMVGGIDGLEPHYKNLVEESGGEFRRHNGHCRRGDRQLEEFVRHADLVVCPISVNSHFGAVGVKRACKRYGITCCFPDSAGVGALRNILMDHFSSDQELNMQS